MCNAPDWIHATCYMQFSCHGRKQITESRASDKPRSLRAGRGNRWSKPSFGSPFFVSPNYFRRGGAPSRSRAELDRDGLAPFRHEVFSRSKTWSIAVVRYHCMLHTPSPLIRYDGHRTEVIIIRLQHLFPARHRLIDLYLH
jgi:hypothetical protein